MGYMTRYAPLEINGKVYARVQDYCQNYKGGE